MFSCKPHCALFYQLLSDHPHWVLLAGVNRALVHWFPDPWLSVWYLHCWMCVCACEYGGADRTLPLWWVFYSSLLPTVHDMAPLQQCHAVMYGCDGRKSLWSGIESAVKKLSMPSVLYAFCPHLRGVPLVTISALRSHILPWPFFWFCPWQISRLLHMLRLCQRFQWISTEVFCWG